MNSCDFSLRRCVLGWILFLIPGYVLADEAQYSQWNWTFSADDRVRSEYKSDFDFNSSKKDNGDQFYQRFRMGENLSLTDEYLNPKLDIFVEGLDGRTAGHILKPPANQNDDFDLHQAYVNWHQILGSDFDLKVGRQELKYGRGRLIMAPTWVNRIRSFDAEVLHYQKKGFWNDLLYAQDVKYDEHHFNESHSNEYLTGFYGGYQENKMAPLFEAYFLKMRDTKGTSDITRYTAGGRFQYIFAPGTVLEAELPYQWGETGTITTKKKDIRAYAYHIELSQSFESACLKPKVLVSYDEASGDKNSKDKESNTFIPLYQSTHDPYGLMDFFRWQNVRNPEASVTLSINDKFKLIPQGDLFWLQKTTDSWYNSSGTAVRTKLTGKRGSYVGSEASLRGLYDFNPNFKLESGIARFFTGDYVKDTGKSDDANWAYAQLVCKY